MFRPCSKRRVGKIVSALHCYEVLQKRRFVTGLPNSHCWDMPGTSDIHI